MKKYSLIIFCLIVFSMFQVAWAEDNVMEEASTLANKETVTEVENKTEDKVENKAEDKVVNNVENKTENKVEDKVEFTNEKLPLDFYESKTFVETEITEQTAQEVTDNAETVSKKAESKKTVATKKVVVNNKAYLRFIAKKNPGLSAQQRELIVASVEKAAKKYNVRSSLIMAVMWKESTYQPYTKTGPCHGLMQLHQAYCGLSRSEIYDIEKNIIYGTRELAYDLKKYGGNEVIALTAYNVGVGNVARGNYRTAYAKNVLAKEQTIIAAVGK